MRTITQMRWEHSTKSGREGGGEVGGGTIEGGENLPTNTVNRNLPW